MSRVRLSLVLLALSACAPSPPAKPAPLADLPTSEEPPIAPAAPIAAPSFDGAKSGQPAPALSLPPVGGGALWTLADNLHPKGEKGSHAALVAIMASWCGYCSQSLPTLKALQDSEPDLVIVTVTIDEKPDAQKAELDKVRAAGLTGPVLVADEAMRAAWMGNSSTVPRYVFVNADGRVTNQDRGFGAKVKPLMAGQARRALGSS